jgi:outer membrane immunogenic protein
MGCFDRGVSGIVAVAAGAVIAAATAGASPALAADLPVAPAQVPYPQVYQPAIYNWSGLYIGLHVGVDALRDTFTDTTGILNTAGTGTRVDPYSYIAGGQIGANYQFASIVIGIEATFGYTQLNGTTYYPSTVLGGLTGSESASSQVPWYATATGRVGYAFNDLLVYGKGGGAWMRANYTEQTLVAGNVSSGQQISANRSGFTAGGGFEYGFTENLSGKIEYDFLDFGTKTYDFNALTFIGIPIGSFPNSVKSNTHMVTAGLNYRFTFGGGWF